MRKPDSKNGVGLRVVQIPLPLEWGQGNDTASSAEVDRGSTSSIAGAAREEKKPKRKWYSLYDKVFAITNLERAFARVQENRGAAGSDGQTVEQFGNRLTMELERLHRELVEKRYRPRPVRRVWIPKASGGKRPLGIPSVRDRVVQQALLQVLGSIFEEKFSRYSHGFRPERGCETALRVVDRVLKAGYEWVLDADIQAFFDNVDHELLLDALNEEVSDGSVLRLTRMFLESGVQVEGAEVEPTERGTPQGSPLSPLLANIYLHRLDAALEESGFGLVRYADDFVIITKSRERAEEALKLVKRELSALKLQLHPEKTRIVAIDEGFEFLGYRYFRDGKGVLQKVVGEKAVRRFREAVRKRTPRHAGQKRRKATHCTLKRLQRNPQLRRIIEELNRYLTGWFGYFRGARTSWSNYYNDEFDRTVRRRLRCLIAGRYVKGRWQQVLSNKLFDDLGLVRLSARAPTSTPLAAPPEFFNNSARRGYPGGSRMR